MVREESKKPNGILLSVIVLLLIIFALFINFGKNDYSATKITKTIEIDDGDEKINWNKHQSYDIALNESIVIAKSGTYHLTGELSDGSIQINTGKEGVVKLILDNVTIKNSSGPAINCIEADDLVIELKGDNKLEDNTVYSADYDEDVRGAIYSKSDLTFEGDGSLTLVANYHDGIVGKDDLKFKSGTYFITAKDDGIRGKDSVYILGGNYTIDSVADAIKSTNEFTNGKGFVVIKDGTFDIKSESAKGIKAINSILLYGGNFSINTYDDSIHSNNYIGILDGDYIINSGDDGIHADRELVIDGGNIDIEKGYEGIEAQAITINDGMISILSSDDGMNAGGGVDSSSTNRPGANSFNTNEDCKIIINGGEIYINAAGDGIDSNGSIYFNGGKVSVDGPTNNSNGSLDSELGITMNGGEVIAVGASGMATNLGEKSTVYNISVYLTSNQLADTEIEVMDLAGNIILKHVSKKSFNHIAAGSENFIPGETYVIYLNGIEYQRFTISNIVTVVGNLNMNQDMRPPKNNK